MESHDDSKIEHPIIIYLGAGSLIIIKYSHEDN